MTKFLKNVDVTGYVSQTSVTSSLVKTDSSGKLVAAVAGTDYATPGALASADKMVTIGRNATGATLYRGTVVYISGSTGNRPNFVKAQANGEATSAGTFGVVLSDIPNNSDGNVVTIGAIDNLDTRSDATNPFTSDTLVDGDTIYLSPTTAGYITRVKPSAPNHIVYVGKVVRTSPTNGTIVYRIQNGYELDEIHDVAISSLANNHTLVWESATSLWKNKTIAATLGYTPADDAAVVKLTGDQTVAGVKTFTSVVNAPTLSLNGGVLAGNNIVSMRSNPTGGQFRIEKSDGSLSAYPFYIGADGTALAYYYNAAGALKVLLHTNDTSYFGNSLSVGYASYAATSYMLDVNGTARLTGALTGTSATFSGAVVVASPFTIKDTNPYIQWKNASDTRLGYIQHATDLVMAADSGNIVLNTASGSFRLTSGGNAGFGVTSPQSQLHLNGTITFSESGYDTVRLHTITHSHSDGSNVNNWLSFNVSNGSGVTNTVLRLNGAGQLRLNSYTASSSFSGTAAGYLAFDSSGNVITVAGVSSTVTAGFSLTTQGAANNTPSVPSVNAGVYAGVYAFIDLATQNENGGWIDFSKGDGSDFAGRIRYYANPERFGFHTAGGVEKITFDAGGNIVLLGGSSSAQSTLASGLVSLRFPNQYSSGYTDAGVKLYIFNSGTTIQGFTAGPAYDLQYHSSGSDSGRHAFYVANSEVIRFNKTLVLSSQDFAVGSAQGFDNTGGWNKNILIDGTNHGRFRIKASNHTYGNIDVQFWADSSVNPSYGISGNKAVFSFGGSITSLTVGGNTVVHAGNIGSQTVLGINAQFLGTASVNVSYGYTAVLRNENGSGGVTSYAPLLHVSASDTMWQIQGTYGTSGNGTMYFRQGYSGSWGTWLTMLSSANYTSYSPSLTGSGASGTWGINITGSSRSLLFSGDSAKVLLDGLWAGGGSYPGYQFTGGNSRFGFSSTSGVVDVYADGNFYATDSSHLVLHAGNYTSYALSLSGGTVTGVTDFGSSSAGNSGIGIQYASTSYGRIRFYQNGSNHQTIHSFGNDGYSPSNGKINIDGQNGANIGPWNDPDFIVNKGAHTYARGYRGIGNVAGTGEATYHPAGIYSTGNNWLYGNIMMNGYSISGANTISGSGLITGGTIRSNTNVYTDQNYGYGLVGVYESTRYQGVFAMGDAYKLSADGTTPGNLYGLAWSHPNAGGQAGYLNNHGLLVMINGGTAAAISSNIWASGSIKASGAMYASDWFRAYGDTGFYTQDYGSHLRRNTRSYGNWEIFGYAKNGYTGIVNVNNYIVSWMLNSSGDFGFLTENGNWWNLFYNNGNNCWGIGTDNTYSGDGFRCVKYGSSQYGWTTWSDRRAKENISNITGALDKVLNMRGVYFNYISDEAKNKRVGFIAQELESVLPEAVRYAEEIDEYNVEYAQIVSVLAEATKEQNDMIVSQATRIEQLELLVQQLINSNNGISN